MKEHSEDTMIQTAFRRLRGCTYTLYTPRPAGRTVTDNAAAILRTLRNREFEALVVSFTDRERDRELYDGMDCLEALCGDAPGMVQVNAYYRREEEDGDGEVLEWYGAELPAGEAAGFFRKVMEDCAVPEEMKGFELKRQELRGGGGR